MTDVHTHFRTLQLFAAELSKVKDFWEHRNRIDLWLKKIKPGNDLPSLRLEWRFDESGFRAGVILEIDWAALNYPEDSNYTNLVGVQVVPDDSISLSPNGARIAARVLIEAAIAADRILLEARMAAKGRFDLDVAP